MGGGGIFAILFLLDWLLFIIIATCLLMLIRQGRAIASLKNDNDIYHDVLSTLNVGFCFIDLKNRIELILFQRIYSLNGLYDILENSDELRKCCADASKMYKSFAITLQIKGKHRYIRCVGKSVVDEANNDIKGVILIFDDISESVQSSTKAEVYTKNILENKQYYMSVLDSAPYLIWEYDDSSKIKYANELYIKSFECHCVVVRDHGASYKKLTVDGGVKVFSVLSIKKKGGVLNFANDMTELTEARETATKLYEDKRRMITCLNTAVACYDQKMRIVLYNNAFVNLWGVEKDWLNKSPYYLDIFDKLYTDGKILKDDFLYNADIFITTLKPYCTLAELPNGNSVNITIIPEIDNGLCFVYESIDKTGE